VLPAPTLVYCAHEYTQSNLRFAAAVEPGSIAVQRRSEHVAQDRAAGRATIPTRIQTELDTNPFLRCTQPGIIRTLQQRGLTDTSELGVFTALREWKNHF